MIRRGCSWTALGRLPRAPLSRNMNGWPSRMRLRIMRRALTSLWYMSFTLPQSTTWFACTLTMYKWSASITCRKPSARLPALTSIDPHIDDYAKHAVDMLIDRIEGYSGPARTYTTDFTLVERASTRLAH